MTQPHPQFDPADPLSADFAAAINRVTQAFIAERTAQLVDIDPMLARVGGLATRLASGGKHIRAAFAWWGFSTYDETPNHPDELLNAVAAVDLYHTGILVHDDLMDESDLRRGNPSAHIEFASWPGASDDSSRTRFGKNAAVLLGSLLQAWADQLLRTSGFPERRVLAGLEVLDTLRTEVLAGQYLDLLAAEGCQLHSENVAIAPDPRADAAKINEFKTARYTVQRPLELGAKLASAPRQLCQGLFDFGLPLGRAFQLRDDLLGVFGSAADTGKPVGDDLKEGKRTLLVAEARSCANAAQQAAIDAVLGNRQADDEQIRAARAAIEQSGAAQRVVQTIEAQKREALARLDSLRLTPTGSTALHAMVTAVTDLSWLQLD
jgi:geranylgeranyl diphosphate synthase type I